MRLLGVKNKLATMELSWTDLITLRQALLYITSAYEASFPANDISEPHHAENLLISSMKTLSDLLLEARRMVGDDEVEVEDGIE